MGKYTEPRSLADKEYGAVLNVKLYRPSFRIFKERDYFLDHHYLSYVEQKSKNPLSHTAIDLALRATSARKEATYQLLSQSYLTSVSFAIT